MLKLTKEEKRMLDGKDGIFKQKAMQKIVEYANALGAEALCTVTKATVYMGNHPYLDVIESDDYNEIFSKMVLCEKGEQIYPLEQFSDECFTQTCVGPCDHFRYQEINISKEVFEKNRKFLDLIHDAGVSIAGSCTPYLSGWIPLRGEHFVSTESSNILFGNSVYGACANADGLEASAWSAICGRTPLWGNHILSNRYATHIVEIQCKSETAKDWDIIGHALGRLLTEGNERPVLTGNFCRPDINRLKKFFSSLATTSGCELCHIVGCTAEAPTLEAALAGHEPKGKIVLTQEEYDRSLASICDEGSGDVQMVVLGCPHYTLEEIRDAARLLEGKQVAEGVSLQIWTDLTMQYLAQVNGYAQTIEASGAHLLNSACPLVCGRTAYDLVKTGFLTDGAKQAHYVHTDLNEKNCKVFYGDMKSCIEASIKGRWEA